MNPTDTRDDLDFDSRESLESEMTWYIPRQARNGYSEFNGVVDHPPLGRGKAEQSETRETRVRRLASDDCARGLVWSFNPSNKKGRSTPPRAWSWSWSCPSCSWSSSSTNNFCKAILVHLARSEAQNGMGAGSQGVKT